ncbi:MAG TPA: hypothetical protein VFR40_04325, partial [Lapillicoccus sp.]|nr:hypothetical protein [Lapillicoccus sp.]
RIAPAFGPPSSKVSRTLPGFGLPHPETGIPVAGAGGAGAGLGVGAFVVGFGDGFVVDFGVGFGDGLGVAFVVVGDGFGGGGTLDTESVSGTRVTVRVGAVTVPVASGTVDRVNGVGDSVDDSVDVATATGTAPPPGIWTQPPTASSPATAVPATTTHEARGRGNTTRRTLAPGASWRVRDCTGSR